jgi:hypothetical protein
MEKQDQPSEVVLYVLVSATLLAMLIMVCFLSWISVFSVQMAVDLEDAPTAVRVLLALTGLAGCTYSVWLALNFLLMGIAVIAKSVNKTAYRVVRLGILRSPKVLFGPIQRALRKNN